ncbi:hypothetical protein M569_08939, partial [Genlisea aurea]
GRMRSRAIEFLMRSAQLLDVSPVVKYSALSLFADRFCPALVRFQNGKRKLNCLLHPIEESNLQLFVLVSLWLSSKIHDSSPLSVKTLKSLSDKFIEDQHYTTGDLAAAEMVFLQALEFEIGTLNIAYTVVERLLSQFKAVARSGEDVAFETCADIMDLLYENEATSDLYSTPLTVVAYLISIRPQKWEFPVLPWAQFATSCRDEEIVDYVKIILKHIFRPN